MPARHDPARLPRRGFLALGLGLAASCAAPAAMPLGVSFHPDRDVPLYRVGEAIRFGVQVSRPAEVIVLNTDARGRVTVLRPNAFDPATRLEPGQIHVFPPRGAAYALRVTDPAGPNTIRVIATTARQALPGVSAVPSDPFATLRSSADEVERGIEIATLATPGASWAVAEYRFSVRP